MRRKLTWVTFFSAAIMVDVPSTSLVLATPASGFVSTTIALGRFDDINVFNHLIPPDFWKPRHRSDIWLSLQRTKGLSDVYVQSNVFAPGGTSGWHTHPGHSLIIVAAGTVTAMKATIASARRTYIRREWGPSIPAVATCTTSGMKTRSKRAPSWCKSFRQMQSVGLTPWIRAIARSDDDRVIKRRIVHRRNEERSHAPGNSQGVICLPGRGRSRSRNSLRPSAPFRWSEILCGGEG